MITKNDGDIGEKEYEGVMVTKRINNNRNIVSEHLNQSDGSSIRKTII